MNKSKIYKYTSIISITIVAILILDLLLPVFNIKADTVYKIGIKIENDKVVVSGSLPETYGTKSELYWVKGTVPAEYKKETQEERNSVKDSFADWVSSNSDSNVIIITQNLTDSETHLPAFSYNMDVSGTSNYNAIILLKKADGTYDDYKILTAQYTEPEASTLNIELATNNNKISITVNSTNANVTDIKYLKSDTDVTAEDVKANGTSVSFTSGANVVCETPELENGTYYVYAENERNLKLVKSLNVTGSQTPTDPQTDPDPLPDPLSPITLSAEFRLPNSISVTANATSNGATVNVLKYAISSTELNADYFAQNGNSIDVGTPAQTVTRLINGVTNGKYYFYAETSDGDKIVESLEVTGVQEQTDPQTDPEPLPDPLSPITVSAEFRLPNSISVTANATSNGATVNVLKYAVSNTELNADYFAQNGTIIDIGTPAQTVTRLINGVTNGKYYFYAETSDGDKIVESLEVTGAQNTNDNSGDNSNSGDNNNSGENNNQGDNNNSGDNNSGDNNNPSESNTPTEQGNTQNNGNNQNSTEGDTIQVDINNNNNNNNNTNNEYSEVKPSNNTPAQTNVSNNNINTTNKTNVEANTQKTEDIIQAGSNDVGIIVAIIIFSIISIGSFAKYKMEKD